jgi:putative tryptophan/tyrosine transport system substrate-binding protein
MNRFPSPLTLLLSRHTRRRDVIALLAGASAWPTAAQAQQRKLPTIGFLGTAVPSTMSEWTAALEQRLRELGWVEGRTVTIAYRWAESRLERYVEIAAEFVRLNVDVIVTTVPAAPAAKQATSVIPIVFILASDPVGTGLVASLARPGGNITGLSTQATDLASKRVELLREVVPDLRMVAILGNIDNPEILLEMHQAETAAQKLGLQVARLAVRHVEDLTPALDSVKGRAQALYVCTDALTSLNRLRINTWALEAQLPTMHDVRNLAEAEGLMSYGPNWSDQFRRAADLVDKILRGAKPGDLPVEQADKFELVVNLKTAKALGLSIPESFLLRADEVIE